MAELNPPKDVLRGSTLGDAHVADFARRTSHLAGESTVILNFRGIEDATASYLKRFFLPLLDDSSGIKVRAMVFPLVAEISDDVRDALHSFLSEKSWVVSEVQSNPTGVSFVGLLGNPESSTEETFNLVQRHQASSAFSLFEASQDNRITQTAWNNRLTNLVILRLAKRSKQGRVWIYQTTFS